MGYLKDFLTDDKGELHPEWLQDAERVKQYYKEHHESSKDSKEIRQRNPQTL